MFIGLDRTHNTLIFNIIPEEGDTGPDPRFAPARSTVTYRFPNPVGAIHPDLLALAALHIVYPFAWRTTFSWSISETFAKAVTAWQKYRVAGPVHPAISSRSRPAERKAGLAFSAGVDSMASLLVLPDNTEMFYSQSEPPTGVSAFKPPPGAIFDAFDRIRDDGRSVFSVATDVEWVRSSYGFPHERSSAIPAILMADERQLDAVAFGTIGEAAYRYGTKGFLDVSETSIPRMDELFSAAGLSVINPVLGMSEVITLRTVHNSPYAGLAQSCGYKSGGCNRCKKCFRKTLLTAAISGEWPSDEDVKAIFSVPVVKEVLAGDPMILGNVYAYAMARYYGNNPILRGFKARLGKSEQETDWMTRYIPSSLDYIPAGYRSDVEANIRAVADPMSASDIATMKAWDTRWLSAK